MEKIKKRSSLYYLENDQLYKRIFSLPLLIWLNEEEANYVLKELHEMISKSHVADASLTFKALRNRYFWLTMKVYALDLVKSCNKC